MKYKKWMFTTLSTCAKFLGCVNFVKVVLLCHKFGIPVISCYTKSKLMILPMISEDSVDWLCIVFNLYTIKGIIS